VHFLSVVDKTNATRDTDRTTTGAAFDAFVVEMDTRDLVHRSVSVYLAPKGPRFLRGLLERLIKLDPPGEQLVIDGPAPSGSIVAAFGDSAGNLNDYLPSQTRERLVRAAGAGFLTAYLAPGRIALVVAPASRDLEAQWTHLRSWL
jgi:hypothetical protein